MRITTPAPPRKEDAVARPHFAYIPVCVRYTDGGHMWVWWEWLLRRDWYSRVSYEWEHDYRLPKEGSPT